MVENKHIITSKATNALQVLKKQQAANPFRHTWYSSVVVSACIVHLTWSLGTAGKESAGGRVFVPAASTDSVAEALLECCGVVLQRCPPHSSQQLLQLLQRFAHIAGLPSATAAEEVC